MKNRIPIRIRVARFLNERYLQRERPGYFAEFFFWGVTVVTALWPMFSLVKAMAMLK